LSVPGFLFHKGHLVEQGIYFLYFLLVARELDDIVAPICHSFPFLLGLVITFQRAKGFRIKDYFFFLAGDKLSPVTGWIVQLFLFYRQHHFQDFRIAVVIQPFVRIGLLLKVITELLEILHAEPDVGQCSLHVFSLAENGTSELMVIECEIRSVTIGNLYQKVDVRHRRRLEEYTPIEEVYVVDVTIVTGYKWWTLPLPGFLFQCGHRPEQPGDFMDCPGIARELNRIAAPVFHMRSLKFVV